MPPHIQLILADIFAEARNLSKQTAPGGTLERNCTYNSRALHTVVESYGYTPTTVRGAANGPDEPTPATLDLPLDEYIMEQGNGHWWVEVELTPDTIWTLDSWSLLPERHGQPLAMAGRPDNYHLLERDPPGRHQFDPEQ